MLFLADKLMTTGSNRNETAFRDPEFDAATAKALAASGDDYTKAVRDIQRIEFERGGYLVWGMADGVDIAAAPSLYRRFRERSEVWKYGLRPDEVDRFLDGYGWRLLDQLGPDQARDRYVRPTGRALPTSSLEWSALARKI